MKNLNIVFVFPKIDKWEITLDTTVGYRNYHIDSYIYDLNYINFVVLGFGFYITWESV